MTFLTIEALRNPNRRSGFNYVGYAASARYPSHKPYQAMKRPSKDSTGNRAIGPRRATPEEAAQDYCDFANGRRGAAALAPLKTAGHEYVVDEQDTDEEYQAALGVLRDRRAQRSGKPGYVYLIIEVRPGGALDYGKIGYSVNPKKRVAELQTGNPRPLCLHALKRGTEDDERALHAKYISQNVLQEWFRLTKPLLLEFDLNSDGDPWGAEEDTQ